MTLNRVIAVVLCHFTKSGSLPFGTNYRPMLN